MPFAKYRFRIRTVHKLLESLRLVEVEVDDVHLEPLHLAGEKNRDDTCTQTSGDNNREDMVDQNSGETNRVCRAR